MNEDFLGKKNNRKESLDSIPILILREYITFMLNVISK